MDHITSYRSRHDRESMSLALKVNIIRSLDDQLEINIGDGLSARAPATRSGRFDRPVSRWKRKLLTYRRCITMKCAPTDPISKNISWLALREKRLARLFKVSCVNSVLPWQFYRPIVALCKKKDGGFGEFVGSWIRGRKPDLTDADVGVSHIDRRATAR